MSDTGREALDLSPSDRKMKNIWCAKLDFFKNGLGSGELGPLSLLAHEWASCHCVLSLSFSF